MRLRAAVQAAVQGATHCRSALGSVSPPAGSHWQPVVCVCARVCVCVFARVCVCLCVRSVFYVCLCLACLLCL